MSSSRLMRPDLELLTRSSCRHAVPALTVNRSIRVGSGIGPRTLAPVRFAVLTISPHRLIEHAVIEGLQANSDILRVHDGVPALCLSADDFGDDAGTDGAAALADGEAQALAPWRSVRSARHASSRCRPASPSRCPSGSCTVPVTSVVRK
jgi:hypothetical protein